jgi:signal transduction histidine kinase
VLTGEFEQDIAAIGSIEAVPTILEVVCRTTGMGFAAVARVTEERWIACSVRDDIAFGLQPGGELKVKTTICNEIRDSRQGVVINHVAQDGAYCGHPTPMMYGFQSYISMPIILPDGTFFGTLCAIDPRPNLLDTPATVGMFKLFSDLIAFHLDAHYRLARNDATLLDERQSAELREQFIAVLGHDLRNPLASIDAGIVTIARTPLNDKAKRAVGLMQNSVGRMTALIDNMLDFARGRLGGGLSLDRSARAVKPILDQVIAEIRSAWPERVVTTDIAFSDTRTIACDPVRIGQLFSNLLANAATHGTLDAPIRIRAAIEDGIFVLVVANSGEPIPQAVMEKLFQPFFRATMQRSQQGLGLGLYIASEIARAHGGRLDVSSTAEETRFTFRMPAR